METKILIAGFGGQGVLFGGTLMAQAALEDGKQTTWFPSYGAEIRGGTANSTVIVSDDEIGSPIVSNPDILIALNEQSLNKFFPKMKEGSLIIINSSLIKRRPDRFDVTIVEVPASEIADKQLGDIRAANLVAVGAMLKAKQVFPLEAAKKAAAIVLSEKPKLIPLNQKALESGFNYKKQ
jgi:2-oxoglutarate ferredoxin oxidoreductase subunit gamma